MADAGVFISWSGEPSRTVALKLRDLISPIIPTADMFLSVDSIQPGTRWSPEVTAALRRCEAGIAIVTPTNLNASWLQFECGAISNQAEDRARVLPLLCGLAEGAVGDGPLNAFQHRPLDEAGVLAAVKLVRDICEPRIKDPALELSFAVWWEKLGADLLAAAAVPGAPAVAAPLTINDLGARIDQLWSAMQAMSVIQGRQTQALDVIHSRVDPYWGTALAGVSQLASYQGGLVPGLVGIAGDIKPYNYLAAEMGRRRRRPKDAATEARAEEEPDPGDDVSEEDFPPDDSEDDEGGGGLHEE